MNGFAEIRRPDAARLSGAAARAGALRERYGELEGEALLRVMLEWEYKGRIALVSSFGAEAALLLDMVARIDPATPVIFIDTGKLFHQTLTYRDILVRRLALSDVRSVGPIAFDLAGHDPDSALWQQNPNLCCYLRKVLPLERALGRFDAWITGRKRDHGGERGGLQTIEAVDGRIRFNPLAHWSQENIDDAFRKRGLPRHPLSEEGYASIGCAPCTEPVSAEAHGRAGRWRGSVKSECGIHHPRWSRNHP
ncbi:MAG: phosphoadenylyl-sulfate reductase [Alphaproteobacteria bacterium]|jgi:phosphoadenosine phosphosulfate reductase|nr:phosphoadenylyl-sulfate reductase [Alphaproteobacteria bacterium]MDP6590764.1 phosphoadenylyl-sulfate reductase [Alphaproteobacteria bacterium]MDP6817079.1 phosphoadenylyl-sulfate reductase [Alphaproteobacteria bacterium]|tara:strand:+ start:379 stop:1131 length:753 start_codon:yes stop_codon:yes gene_type:complete